jgi:predicted DNA-binding transcriptional regulator AlpA
VFGAVLTAGPRPRGLFVHGLVARHRRTITAWTRALFVESLFDTATGKSYGAVERSRPLRCAISVPPAGAGHGPGGAPTPAGASLGYVKALTPTSRDRAGDPAEALTVTKTVELCRGLQGQTLKVAKKLDLVGVWEIAEMLGVSRQRVHQLLRDHPDFPRPVADLKAGKIWFRTDIASWAARYRR